jgi:RNA polymerase sigma-70 factor (ECF subfamily)
MRAGEASEPLAKMTGLLRNPVSRDKASVSALSIEGLLVHQETVFKICLGFARDYAEAEDLTQEAYLKACQSLQNLRNPPQVREWLIRIAKNACLDQQKKDRTRGIILRRWARESEATTPAEAAKDPDNKRRRLKSAVRRLPQKLRTVFILREYGRLTYDDLAATLGLRKGTVMSRLSRARGRIAAALQEKNHGRP